MPCNQSFCQEVFVLATVTLLICTVGTQPLYNEPGSLNQTTAIEMMNPIRYACFVLLGILTLQACSGQAADTSQPKSSSKGGWLTNLNEAQAQSVKENKPILVYFTARDTCDLCKQMDEAVFSSSTFKDWA